MTKDKLAEARMAALRLVLLPDEYKYFTKDQREFICSDIVGELLEGK